MSEARRQALEYLRLPPGSPWKWEEGGQVLVTAEGTTVVFREELTVIIERLAGRSLPPFVAIAYLIAACRVKDFESMGYLLSACRGQTVITGNPEQRAADYEKLPERFAELFKLPFGLVVFAEAVFESFASSQLPAQQILAGIREDFTDAELNTPDRDAPRFDYSPTIHAVIKGFERHTAESLLLRLKTGLDALPKAAKEIVIPASARARQLLAELRENDEFSGLATIAHELMAALRLPARAAEIDACALGGAAGLSNRGTLDRLLLSELAYDDATLATRVALNEALYLHREPPAVKPDRSLTLVIDSGLRMWGIPRVIAASAALALLAGHRGAGAVATWRPEGDVLRPVDLLSRDGLQSHLAVLRTELDPRRALPALVEAVSHDGTSDLVLVTHRDALDDLTLQALLASLKPGRGFLLLIDNKSTVQLHVLPWGSPRPLCQVQLHVDKLFDAPNAKARPSLVDESKAVDLPAIFREPRFPLLLSANGKMEMTVRTAKGGMCITSDRRLLRWELGPCGAEQLLTDLPIKGTCWLGEDNEGRVIVVRGKHGCGLLAAIIFEDKTSPHHVIQFTGPRVPSAVYVDQSVLLVILYKRVVVISLATAAIVSETAFPSGMEWISGRYFSPGTGVCFASWNGTAVRWDDVVVGRSLKRDEITLVFDREGIGAWLLLRSGEILNPAGQKLMETGWPVESARSTASGDALLVTRRLAGEEEIAEQYSVKLKHKSVYLHPAKSDPEWFDKVLAPSRSLQTRFNAIYAEPGQPLRLRKSKGRWIEIFISPKSMRFAESSKNTVHMTATLRSFEAQPAPHSLGCSLKVATWPGGSKAWLDSRGLLHLRSHDVSIPELTLTLNHGDMAAWTSDGLRCGYPFFAGKDQPTDTSHAAAVLKSFCDLLC